MTSAYNVAHGLNLNLRVVRFARGKSGGRAGGASDGLDCGVEWLRSRKRGKFWLLFFLCGLHRLETCFVSVKARIQHDLSSQDA